MKFVYNVVYYKYNSLFNKHEYENEYFTSKKKAKQFLFIIVKEENRKYSDIDFYEWKIKIIKSVLNNWELENREYIYDLCGNLLYDSKNIYKDKCLKKVDSRNIGKIIEIKPFPWNKNTQMPLQIYGVIGSVCKNEYIIYLFDDLKLIHTHECHEAVNFIVEDKVDKEVIILSKIIKKEIIMSNKLFKKFIDNEIVLNNSDLIYSYIRPNEKKWINTKK